VCFGGDLDGEDVVRLGALFVHFGFTDSALLLCPSHQFHHIIGTSSKL